MHVTGHNNQLIEHILSLLKFLQVNHIEIEHLMEENELDAPLSSRDAKDIRTAYEIIKFMDDIPGGFLIYHADGNEEIIYANKGLLHIFQCATLKEFREITHNSFRGMVHPDDLEAVEQSIWQQIADNLYDLDYVEYRAIRRDGAVRWLEDYGHFVHSRAVGDIFYVFLGDATEKKDRQRLERAALLQKKEQREQKLQNIIEAYDKERALIHQEHLRRLEVIEGLSVNYESILYADLDDNSILPYRLSSRTQLQFQEKFQMRDFGWYVADYVRTWVHPEDRDMVAQATAPSYIRQKLTETATYYVNYRVLEHSETQYLQLRIVNVGHADQVSQIVMGYRRIDDELKQELEQNQLLVEALNNANLAISAKNTFLSNMSHDMRTPLNAIFGFTALARKNIYNPDAALNYLDRTDASSQELLDLIDRVLEVSYTGEMHLEESECDLCDIMQGVYQFVGPQAEKKSLDLSLDCGGVAHSGILGDEQKLKQLVLYLTNNAITYTNPNGKVSMRLTEMVDSNHPYAVYQLAIEDTGIGISADFMEHLFEPFAREKNTTMSGVYGVGLGLTIVKNIVEMMHGSIHVDSSVGKGSTFTVTLRLRTQQEESSPAFDDASGAMNPFPTQAQRILLVEDNELNMEIETEILQDMGFEIDTASDGSIAVDKMRNATPEEYDLILMDIQMPCMNGWQATKAIRQLNDPALARIPIIALSANVFESDIRTSLESGMDAHLRKPLDISQLLETIEEIMRKRKR